MGGIGVTVRMAQLTKDKFTPEGQDPSEDLVRI